MSFAKELETRNTAAWNAWRMMGDFGKAPANFKFKCIVCKAIVQCAPHLGLCAFAGPNGSFYRTNFCHWKRVRTDDRVDSLSWRGETGTVNQKEDTSRAKVHLKPGIAMELRMRRVGLGKKNGGGNSEGESRPQKYQSMTSEEKLAAGAASWAKRFEMTLNL